MTQLAWLDSSTPFPPPETALTEPNGLIAAGGDLSPERILNAYHQGIFPWYSDGQPILWWSPDPRCIIYPKDVHCAKSLVKHLRKHPLRISFDHAFEQVIRYCARHDTDQGTWITTEMESAYVKLHHLGYAHSVEVWQDSELVGGLYGLAIGKVFFGESMFSLQTNASKVAFISLCRQLERWNFKLIDCQVENPHLISLGAQCIVRKRFLEELETGLKRQDNGHDWRFESEDASSLIQRTQQAKAGT